VGAEGQGETAVLFRSERWGIVRLRRTVGSLERPEWQLGQDLLDLTTTPNAVTSAVHDRMPVILDPDNYDLWLDPGMTNVEAVSEMLKPFDARLMRCYPVSTRINYVANDDAECSVPVELSETQAGLFP